MKKVTAVIMVLLFLMLSIGYVAPSSAVEPVTQTIASVAKAQELATAAGGTFVEGATAPALTGTQVALPVIDSATGAVVGHVVAEQAALVSALNAAGYASVASAVAASSAGTAAGLAVGAGVATGTIVAGTAVVAGAAALAVSSGGGGGTTSHH